MIKFTPNPNLANELGDFPIECACGKCGRKFSESIRNLKANGHATCPGCGDTANLDEAERKAIAALEQEILRFSRSFK